MTVALVFKDWNARRIPHEPHADEHFSLGLETEVREVARL